MLIKLEKRTISKHLRWNFRAYGAYKLDEFEILFDKIAPTIAFLSTFERNYRGLIVATVE